MTHRILPKSRTAYRIGDIGGGYPVFSGDGSALFPGRWNKTGEDVIYAGVTYSTALLEKLVRLGQLPANQHYVEITIEAGVSYEVAIDATVPGWYRADQVASREYGSVWFQSRRSAVLFVPSVVAPLDQNVLINPHHADFANIFAGLETPVPWDARLFG